MKFGSFLSVINDRYEYNFLNSYLEHTEEGRVWVGFYVDKIVEKIADHEDHPINKLDESKSSSEASVLIKNAKWINGQPITFPAWWTMKLGIPYLHNHPLGSRKSSISDDVSDISRGFCGYFHAYQNESKLWKLTNCEDKNAYFCKSKYNLSLNYLLIFFILR